MGFSSGSTDRFWEAELQTKLVRECRVNEVAHLIHFQLWVGKVLTREFLWEKTNGNSVRGGKWWLSL